MAPSTLTLNSTNTQATGQYKRSLKVSGGTSTTNNNYIQPGTGNTSVNGMWIQDSLVVEGAAFQSDNTNSGITFIALQRLTGGRAYNKITLNVGANSTGTNDKNDSIYIDSGNHQISGVTNSTIITGNEQVTADSTAAQDGDLIFFGAEKSLDTSSYPIALKSSTGQVLISGTVGNAEVPTSPFALSITGDTIQMGKGNDSLIFGNTNASSVIGGTTSDMGNIFDVGTGADFIYFASPSTISGNNVLNIGNTDGTADNDSDSICLNYLKVNNTVTGTNLGANSAILVRGFKDSQDKFYYNGVVYDKKADISSITGNKITFS
jgi:hypothetical protein